MAAPKLEYAALRRLVAVLVLSLLTACASNDYPPDPRYSARGADRTSSAHVVARGDTVYSIARRYGVGPRDLARHNNLPSSNLIVPGQVLFIPGRSQSTATVTIDPPTRQPQAKPAQIANAGPVRMPENTAAPRAAATPATLPEAAMPPPLASGGFLWPTKGKIISRFGSKGGGLQNDGINIAAPRGSIVVAAQSGTIIYAGTEVGGFGRLLLIKHDDGWTTAYAHNDELLVKRGDKVARGEAIARVGSSGNVDEPQLHFELRRNTKAINPEPHLTGGAQFASS